VRVVVSVNRRTPEQSAIGNAIGNRQSAIRPAFAEGSGGQAIGNPQ
jgi:hypothetical protein